MTRGLTEKDLVFTLAGNGISSLLTMPAPGLTIEEVSNVTRVMQIERGVPTPDLNPVRTHLDAMKGGKISRHIRPAKMVHLMGTEPRSYYHYMTNNSFIHTLPDYSTFKTAIDNVKKWDAWDAVSPAVRRHLETADPAQETVKQAEFETWGSRIYGLMPGRALPAAMKKAEELGFKAVLLADQMSNIEASQVGLVLAQIARTIEEKGQPFEPPVALFTDGELVVTVGQSNGVGGRHQEMTLTSAQRISGSKNIVIGSVDTDGTDGPGTQYTDGTLNIPCLAGGVVDGTTMDSARRLGIDVVEELKQHNTTPPMWKLNSGIIATPNIRVGDIIVALIAGRK
jgi:glycerate-2-kinase